MDLNGVGVPKYRNVSVPSMDNSVNVTISYYVYCFQAKNLVLHFDYLLMNSVSVVNIQGVPDQNLQLQIALTQKLCMSDPNLEKPKYV